MNVYMQEAVAVARQAALVSAEVPVGAVIVRNEEIIARAHNRKEELHDVTAHAEILVLRKASALLKDWRLSDCDLYVTLEPCPMCMAAIRDARIRRLYFGAYRPADAPRAKEPETYCGIEEETCTLLLQDFFQNQRNTP